MARRPERLLLTEENESLVSNDKKIDEFVDSNGKKGKGKNKNKKAPEEKTDSNVKSENVEPEVRTKTYAEYQKEMEEKRKALSTVKAKQRTVKKDKEFESMQQFSVKKANDEIFIKLKSDSNGVEKSKKVEKAKKVEESKDEKKDEESKDGKKVILNPKDLLGFRLRRIERPPRNPAGFGGGRGCGGDRPVVSGENAANTSPSAQKPATGDNVKNNSDEKLPTAGDNAKNNSAEKLPTAGDNANSAEKLPTGDTAQRGRGHGNYTNNSAPGQATGDRFVGSGGDNAPPRGGYGRVRGRGSYYGRGRGCGGPPVPKDFLEKYFPPLGAQPPTAGAPASTTPSAPGQMKSPAPALTRATAPTQTPAPAQTQATAPAPAQTQPSAPAPAPAPAPAHTQALMKLLKLLLKQKY